MEIIVYCTGNIAQEILHSNINRHFKTFYDINSQAFVITSNNLLQRKSNSRDLTNKSGYSGRISSYFN